MKWSNVLLIFSRELRDQLRDRRTLFTVLILPLVLYPIMGMAMLQVSQFMRQHPTRIWLVGTENLPDSPALLSENKIDSELIDKSEEGLIDLVLSSEQDAEFQRLIELFKDQGDQKRGGAMLDQLLQQEMARREIDLAVFIPQKIQAGLDSRNDVPPSSVSDSEMAQAIESERNSEIETTLPSDATASTGQTPRVYIFRNSASDKSNIAAERMNRILGLWQKKVLAGVLAKHNISQMEIQAFRVANADVADQQGRQAATWSKILPFVVMIWCLTGAFYPAVDLCAGEKERGTFETLLSSPARRDEIAIGKLLTVMSFSIVTSLFNLLSMGFTGAIVMSRLGAGLGGMGAGLGMPPISSIGWLLMALIPISALFSAVALAAASFARSSKEGQYYLVPLMMISMPLMMLPMLPAAELDLGTSLIPVSGLMMLLRGLIEGQYTETLQYAGPVCAVTLVCCLLAIRWVVSQFNSESVLFPASERFAIGAWCRHVMRERNAMPTIGHAVLCCVTILILKFFIGLVAQTPESWTQFSKQTIVILIASVGTPAVLMAIVLTRNPIRSLRLRKCSLAIAFSAVLLAVCMHPLVMWVTTVVLEIYPPTGDMHAMQDVMANIMGGSPGVWAIILVFAVAPALAEELAFRGFILSGLQSIRSNFKAIVLTSIMFGLAHSILQQSIVTFFVGMLLGFLAVRTGSLIPCVLYHATHNAISVLLSMGGAGAAEGPFAWLLESTDGAGVQYSFGPAVLLVGLGVLLMVWLYRNTHAESQQDSLGGVADVPTPELRSVQPVNQFRETLDTFVARLTAKTEKR